MCNRRKCVSNEYDLSIHTGFIHRQNKFIDKKKTGHPLNEQFCAWLLFLFYSLSFFSPLNIFIASIYWLWIYFWWYISTYKTDFRRCSAFQFKVAVLHKQNTLSFIIDVNSCFTFFPEKYVFFIDTFLITCTIEERKREEKNKQFDIDRCIMLHNQGIDTGFFLCVINLNVKEM